VQLNNVFMTNEHLPVNISVCGEKIHGLSSVINLYDPDRVQIYFADAIAIPGLINSHDHLDFNCFKPLGERTFNNYTEWGRNIHQNFKDEIKSILKIPQRLRTAWGMYKNLLSGITTVVNHGDFLHIENPLIDIYQEPQNLHSVHFEKNWIWKLNNPLNKSRDCIIHTGEGKDEQSVLEIDKLIKFNLLKRNLVGVHGVAMNSEQAKNFKALIWCPESNRVLLNKHAPVAHLKKIIRIVFGTDSTLTGDWNIWNHLRLAESLQLVNDVELFEMVTGSPADLWNLNKGQLEPGRDADIIIIQNKHASHGISELLQTNPEDILMVIHRGNIRLFDESLLPQFKKLPFTISRFSRVEINGRIKFTEGNLPDLISAIKSYQPSVNFPVGVFEPTIQPVYD
jgi:cytosine/adenosine deaminase-related metal-dependent hydrolase